MARVEKLAVNVGCTFCEEQVPITIDVAIQTEYEPISGAMLVSAAVISIDTHETFDHQITYHMWEQLGLD